MGEKKHSWEYSKRTMELINRWLDENDYIVIRSGGAKQAGWVGSGSMELKKLIITVLGKSGRKTIKHQKEQSLKGKFVCLGDTLEVKYSLNIG